MPATMPGLMTIRAAPRRAAGRPHAGASAGAAALCMVQSGGLGRAGRLAYWVRTGFGGGLPVWVSWPAAASTATASSTPRTAVAVSGIV
jgi:hypothetical protein